MSLWAWYFFFEETHVQSIYTHMRMRAREDSLRSL